MMHPHPLQITVFVQELIFASELDLQATNPKRTETVIQSYYVHTNVSGISLLVECLQFLWINCDLQI